MAVYQIEPLRDRLRWNDLVEAHPLSSVFHSSAWLEALSATYGYKVQALTTTQPGQPLKNALVYCRVKSWVTGERAVSLPFSDHCQPLAENADDLKELVRALKQTTGPKKSRYSELRPKERLTRGVTEETGLAESAAYCLHTLDLRSTEEDLFRRFHKSCVQRKLQRAEREGVRLQDEGPETALATFYDLLLLTRRRHQLPPQPISWFRNLIECFGENLRILVAVKDERPIASILLLNHKNCVTYKYGCSDAQFHSLGGMPFLFWRAIRQAKARGIEEFDFGRSDLDNPGLITFKDNWGGTRGDLVYYRLRSPFGQVKKMPGTDMARRALSLIPDSCLKLAGRLLYRHIG